MRPDTGSFNMRVCSAAGTALILAIADASLSECHVQEMHALVALSGPWFHVNTPGRAIATRSILTRVTAAWHSDPLQCRWHAVPGIAPADARCILTLNSTNTAQVEDQRCYTRTRRASDGQREASKAYQSSWADAMPRRILHRGSNKLDRDQEIAKRVKPAPAHAPVSEPSAHPG
jgi:hypothetical protein